LSSINSISVIGLGFVGLCTALVFASRGVRTIGLDIDYHKLETIRNGSAPIYEPEVDKLLKNSIKSGSISFTDDFEHAVLSTDATFVTVGTPSSVNGSIDLSQVKLSVRSLGEALAIKDNYHLIVIKSTVIPGTTERIVREVLEKESGKIVGKNFGLVYNPEFLREGNAVADIRKPHAIIIGSLNSKDSESLEIFYKNFYRPDAPKIIKTNITTAEMVKYANNAFLATKISFINTIANICQRVKGTDVGIVAHAIGLDPRIGSLFLQAGAGYGGSCLPKDLKAFINFSKELDSDTSLLEKVQDVNEKQIFKVILLVEKMIGDITGKTIAVLGLAFKKDSDDVREAASIRLIRQLLAKGALVKVHDPRALDNTKKLLRNLISYCSSAVECISGSDCCVFMTEWDEYKEIDPDTIIRYMKKPCVVDARRMFEPAKYVDKVKFAMLGSNFEKIE
jgi:UDPglucose 6-dehydrogenase